MTSQVVAVDDDAFDGWAEAVARQFHEDPVSDIDRAWMRDIPGDRRFAVWDGDRIVATAGALTLEIGVGGGATLPCAGVTVVGVAQTHRRRGLLRALMARVREDALARDEPVAALFASESAIYPRFGFGPAADLRVVRLERAHARFVAPVDVGLVEARDVADAPDVLAPILAGLRATTPGVVTRTPQMWNTWARQGDPAEESEGCSKRRLVVVPDRGYATYRVRPLWRDGLPDGEVRIQELVALDGEAEQALWQHCADIDLTTRLTVAVRPADDVLPLRLVDPLRVTATPVSPLYTALLDVPRALSARPAATDGAVTLAVEDPDAHQSGTLRIEAAAGRLDAVWTSGRPELTLPVDVLGACWLGGNTATRWRDAGRLVEHVPGAAHRLDSMLAVERQPWQPFEF